MIATLQIAGPTALAELRQMGQDRAHAPEARRKPRLAMIRCREEERAWERNHVGPYDASEFTKTILPGLTRVSLRAIMRATGLSIVSCSHVRRGMRIPHPRFWDALRRLTEPLAK